MKAIRTRFFGPGNVKGSRYKASDEDGNSITVSTDFSVGSDGNHDRAALALCEKMGWGGELISGGLKNGNVYIFGPDTTGPARVRS